MILILKVNQMFLKSFYGNTNAINPLMPGGNKKVTHT